MTNRLIVIENGRLSIYSLDDRLTWELGRPTDNNHLDIELLSSTVSRRHGKFQNTDGYWFYVDYNGKTVRSIMADRLPPVSAGNENRYCCPMEMC